MHWDAQSGHWSCQNITSFIWNAVGPPTQEQPQSWKQTHMDTPSLCSICFQACRPHSLPHAGFILHPCLQTSCWDLWLAHLGLWILPAKQRRAKTAEIRNEVKVHFILGILSVCFWLYFIILMVSPGKGKPQSSLGKLRFPHCFASIVWKPGSLWPRGDNVTTCSTCHDSKISWADKAMLMRKLKQVKCTFFPITLLPGAVLIMGKVSKHALNVASWVDLL